MMSQSAVERKNSVPTPIVAKSLKLTNLQRKSTVQNARGRFALNVASNGTKEKAVRLLKKQCMKAGHIILVHIDALNVKFLSKRI
jgi:hypothetical protein